MSGYAKIFAGLWNGTLFGKPDAQLVFIFLLARCDAEGCVRCVPEAIAAPTGLPLERVREALGLLERPDPASNSTELEGARLERLEVEGSWRIVNYLRYRNMPSPERVREQTRERVRRYREVRKLPVTQSNGRKRQAEAEADAEAEEPPPPTACAEASSAPPAVRLPGLQGEYAVSSTELGHLRGLYPGIDVLGQLRAMRGWLISNPTRRKTTRGMPRFVHAWLAREQNRAHGPPTPTSHRSGNERRYSDANPSGDEDNG